MDQEFKTSTINTPEEIKEDIRKNKKITKKNQVENIRYEKGKIKGNKIKKSIHGRTSSIDTAKKPAVSWQIRLRNSPGMQQKRVR